MAKPSSTVVPWGDQLLFSARRVFVIHIRRGGNIERLVRERLAGKGASDIFVVDNDLLLNGGLRDQLYASGARRLPATDETVEFPLDGVCDCRPAGSNTASNSRSYAAPYFRLSEAAPWEPYLAHCTRSSYGPWPDQSQEQFFASLLRGELQGERTALASLQRIVGTRRIVATNAGIRGGSRVVCLTQVPLAELRARRVFRPHRGRWDLEPYGICIQRDWLTARGARPVLYGDDQMWGELPDCDRPFFQKQFSRGRRSTNGYDWSVEQEWRHVGDVELDELPEDAGMLFVPTEDEAGMLANISPWPIVVLG